VIHIIVTPPWSGVTQSRYTNEAVTSFDDLNSAPFVSELQRGSEEAFERLVDRLLPPLFKFLTVRMSVPEPTAEELAADVLMTVHEKLPNFRFGSRAKLTTWIFEIAKNRAIDYHRVRRPAFEDVTGVALRANRDADLAPSEREDALMQWLRAQLSQLSEGDQQILKWRALDFPFAEIAEWLEIPEGTARVRHKRALDKLKAASGARMSQGV
jgi:RNA polymerase sigma factor (sigma-70 family)